MFKQDEKVIIHSLGDGQEYRAKVVGIYTETAYIVELIDPIPGINWTHSVFIQSVIRKYQ